jgi:hypothetical protein
MQRIRDLLNRANGEAEEAVIIPEVVEPLNATLMAHAGATKLTRQELQTLPIPEATDTFRPIAHATLIDRLEEALAFRHISITRDEYAVSKDGMKMFGLVEVNADHEGIRFAIGLRNANDRSMRVGMVAGYRVFICDNLALSGDFQAILAKHSKHYDLVESLTIGVDRLQRSWEPLKRTIEAKRNLQLTEGYAQSIIYKAFMTQRFPVKLLRAVHNEFFISPSYDEFKPPTLWSLENSFTTAFKQLKPIQQFQMTARLGKFLKPYTS